MREIKFRAWNERTRKMFLVEQIMLKDALLVGEPNPETFGQKVLDMGRRRITSEILMQFTGLKDKNDTEIYEGDIVSDDRGFIGEVFWNESAARFFFDSSHGLEISEPQYSMQVIVIGNIHEDSKLLTKLKQEVT